MSTLPGWRRFLPALRPTGVAAVGLLALGLLLRLTNAWTDLDALSLTTLPDDSFYYFGIARHLARGGPPSLDGLNPTNGYHPLWMALLVPLYRYGGWADAVRSPIHTALTFGAVLDVAAGYFFWRILRALHVRPLPRLIALGLFVANPYGIALATSGLETSLTLCLGLGLYLLHLQSEAPRAPSWQKSAITFGVVGGLMILARTDHLFVFALLIAVKVWRWRRGSALVPSAGIKRWCAVACAVAALIVLPWPIYSFRTTGAVVQSSSLAMAVVLDRMPEVWGFAETPPWLRLERLASSVGEALDRVLGLSGIGALPFSMALAVAFAGCVMAAGRRRRIFGAQLARAAPLFIAVGGLFLLHTLVRKVFREWYAPPLVTALFIALALVLDALVRASRWPRWVALGSAVFLAVCLAQSWRAWRKEGLYFPPANYRAMTPDGSVREGHTDCGAVSYFIDAQITNLDGVVNQAALEALKRGQLIDYVREQHFDRIYLTEQHQSHVFFGARYREQLRGDERDVRAQRIVASEAEKNSLIRISHEPSNVGDKQGRELLGDGWEWPTHAEPGWLVESVGHFSEIVFVASSRRGPETTLQIEVGAAEVDDGEVQRTTVFLNDAQVALLEIRRELTWYSVPAERLKRGRNRLRLEYQSARPNRRATGNKEWWSWWRFIGGNALRAVQMRSVRFSTGAEARLPPEGPALAEPGSELVLEAGFLGVERQASGPAAVWAVASSAEVLFFSSLPPGPHQLVLEVGPPPPDGAKIGQTMTVLLNGRRLGQLELREGEVASHRLEVPSGLLTEGKNRLVFEFARLSARDESGAERAAYFRRIALE